MTNYTSKIIPLEIEHSVQRLPSAKDAPDVAWPMAIGVSQRGPILSAMGSRQRERELLEIYHNDYNTLFPAAAAVLAKQVQSTPWEIQGNEHDVQIYQDVLMAADFGHGMDTFLSKLVLDFCRFDFGAYVEIIGPGDPDQPMPGAAVGLSILDSLRCWPTGDPQYPVIYMDALSELHLLHYSRVVRFYDMPDTSDLPYRGYYGLLTRGVHYGECALSRAISSVVRDMLMNRYIEQKLDDNPPPGFMILKNVNNQTLQLGIEQMEKERATDQKGLWGRNIRIYGTQTEIMPEIQIIPFSEPPEAFNYETYKNICAREVAASVGVDVQDFWELTGGKNLGTATQSAILHEKAKGKALGRLLKGIERVINQILPEDLQFEFKYRDSQEDIEVANKAQVWVGIVAALEGKLDKEQQLRLLANQVEAIRDVITDESGEIKLPDDDPKTQAQGQPPEIVVAEDDQQATAPGAVIADDTEKSLSAEQDTFRGIFRQIISVANDGVISQGAARAALRAQLQESGERIYKDGLADGGAEPLLDDEAVQEIAVWRANQTMFIEKFVSDVYSEKDFLPDEIARRADMWVNKALNPLYYAAMGNANKNALYMWVVNPIKEH